MLRSRGDSPRWSADESSCPAQTGTFIRWTQRPGAGIGRLKRNRRREPPSSSPRFRGRGSAMARSSEIRGQTPTPLTPPPGNCCGKCASTTSDAVLAFDLDSGKLLCTKQLTENDIFNIVCAGAGCGEHLGPDFDIGASPILATLANGKRALLISQKSGVARALDADDNGRILWETRVGKGGRLGGIQWGSAYDGKNMYVAISDVAHLRGSGIGKMVVDPKVGGGLFALDVATGEKVWAAPPASCGERPSCSPAQSAAVSVIPGVVFSGAVDGHLRA